ncbi:MAG TPA: PKD domain-containing protein [Acidimicrobiia bacterium]
MRTSSSGGRWRVGAIVVMVLSGSLAWAAPAGAAGPGTPYTWGSNGYGQLGDGSMAPHDTPEAVNLDDVVDLHGGREHVIALLSNGTVRTWGRNNFGQIGAGGGGNRTSPTAVPGLSNVASVSTGHYHSLARLANGNVWTWGYNAFGQLGDGTTTHRNSPVQVQGLDDAVTIAAGRSMSYAIRSNGTLWGWGLNSSGQLGDGTFVQRTTPVRVGSLTGVVGVAGGRDHGVAVLGNGNVWAWGNNAYGQVGDGTTGNRSSPVQVNLPADAVAVSAGAHHSYALLADGRVFSWGRNYRAELGDGTTTRRLTPVQVSGITTAVAIGSGRDHGIAVLANGTARAWGYNAGGQLGDGTTTRRTTPVTVIGLDDAEIVAGGSDYTVALVTSGPPPPNQPPTARFTSSCSALSCSFNGVTSSDPDGSIVGYAWSFGNGSNGIGVAPGHDYAAAGTYTVALTVTDNDGAVDSTSSQVTVDDTVPANPIFRASASTNGNLITSTLTVPGSVQQGDVLVLVVTVNRNTSVNSAPAGWTLLGTEQDGSPDMESWLYTRTAPAGYGGAQVAVGLAGRSKTDLTLLAYDGAGPVTAFDSAPQPGNGTSHTAPGVPVASAGSVVVAYWSVKTGTNTGWTVPGAMTLRQTSSGSGGGRINSATAETSPLGTGAWPGAAATSSTAASKAIMWSVVIPPG